jgi:hypothetical protein
MGGPAWARVPTRGLAGGGRTQRGARKPTPVRLSCPGRADEHSPSESADARKDGRARDGMDWTEGDGRCCHLDNLRHQMPKILPNISNSSSH